jgi:hypothetical protein
MSYSLLTGLVYIPGQESSYTYRIDPNFAYVPGSRNLGMQGGLGPRLPNGQTGAPPPPPAAAAPAHEPEGAENQPQATGGFLVAWDPKTEKERLADHRGRRNERWGRHARDGRQSGIPRFHRLQRHHRREAVGADLGGQNVTPVSYALDGKQYVTLFARGYPNNKLFTFVLDGKEPIPSAGTTPR